MVAEPVIDVCHLRTAFGDQIIHQDVSFSVNHGEIHAIIGASGAGKTTILRSILMLNRPTAGQIKVFGVDVWHCDAPTAQRIRCSWGMMFQGGALFSSLTVLQNIMFPMDEFTQLTRAQQRELALLKIHLVGLPLTAADKYPSELSGGMRKRAAAARAIALDPQLLFFDEPTSGLDPKGSNSFSQLIVELRDTLGLTVVMVTHDVKLLATVTDKIVFLGEGRVLAHCPLAELRQQSHSEIQQYFKQ
ncbi:MAG: ATP-binding cassette domain-containing protein [Legionellales bacterium]|nr:ATP-binding cassette domain-containing protein [Legionellales bacterium]